MIDPKETKLKKITVIALLSVIILALLQFFIPVLKRKTALVTPAQIPNLYSPKDAAPEKKVVGIVENNPNPKAEKKATVSKTQMLDIISSNETDTTNGNDVNPTNGAQGNVELFDGYMTVSFSSPNGRSVFLSITSSQDLKSLVISSSKFTGFGNFTKENQDMFTKIFIESIQSSLMDLIQASEFKSINISHDKISIVYL